MFPESILPNQQFRFSEQLTYIFCCGAFHVSYYLRIISSINGERDEEMYVIKENTISNQVKRLAYLCLLNGFQQDLDGSFVRKIGLRLYVTRVKKYVPP